MNPANFSLFALLLSVFVGGAYLRGEISRKQDLKEELRMMKDRQRLIMDNVDSINVRYQRDREMMLAQTIEFYGRIDTILQQKFANARQIRDASQSIQKGRVELKMQVQALRIASRQRIIVLPADTEE